MFRKPSRLFYISAFYTCLVLAIAVVFTFLVYDGQGEAKKATSTPESLIGEWHQVGRSGAEGIILEAFVTADSIQINMQTREYTKLYWLGTFDTDGDPAGSYEIISQGNPDAMARSVFGSLDKNKLFDYKNGDLSFKFTMMGETSVVHLSK